MVSETATLFKNLFMTKKPLSRENYPAWSTSDARNYTFVNEIWTSDPAVPPSQDIPAENDNITSSVHGSENGNIAENKQLYKLLLNSLMESHWILRISFQCLQSQ